MGIIKVLKDAVGGGLGDQWLEVIEAKHLSPSTVMCPGVRVREGDDRDSNLHGTGSTISNGSLIHVGEGQCMLLIDGGKIVDYSAEPGYYKVENSSLPSMLDGEFMKSIKESFNRFRYAGMTPLKQKVVYVNLQEIREIKFGTPNPVNYFDNFYNAELFLRAHGSYSIRVIDPILFYTQVGDRTMEDSIEMETINTQYRNEFLTAFQASINQLSVDGLRISHVTSKSEHLAKYMQDALDEAWLEHRGFQIEGVGIASISYTEESQALINLRNKGAMLSDASIREGYVQGSIARGLEAAGSNEAGAAATFMGLGMGMNTIGGGMGMFSQTNAQQMQMQQQQAQQQQAGAVIASAADGWACGECGTQNRSGKFCSNCGTKRPEPSESKAHFCPKCGTQIEPEGAKFCPECGHSLTPPTDD